MPGTKAKKASAKRKNMHKKKAKKASKAEVLKLAEYEDDDDDDNDDDDGEEEKEEALRTAMLANRVVVDTGLRSKYGAQTTFTARFDRFRNEEVFRESNYQARHEISCNIFQKA